eukprot:15475634-Alexandrium_andersonii.AAC.1
MREELSKFGGHCPMQGKRAAELVCGRMDTLVHGLAQANLNSLLQRRSQLPDDLRASLTRWLSRQT